MLWHTLAMSVQDPENKSENAEPRSDSSDGDSSKSGVESVTGRQKEIGGRGGLDPTRYGDWEKAGRCIDF